MVLLALVAAFCTLTVLRAVLVYRRTGINPVTLKVDDSVHGVLGRVLAVSVAGLVCIALVYALAPGWKPWLVPIPYLETVGLRTAGVVLAALAILWIGVAQVHMAASFRVGLDTAERTDLVRRGLFSISRNPIYLGILAAVCGFFLQAPNALGFAVVVAAVLGFAVAVRQEEDYLLTQHGAAYRDYMSRVRRWLGRHR